MLLFQSPLVQAIFSRDAEEVASLLNHNEDATSLVILSHYRTNTNPNTKLRSDNNLYMDHTCVAIFL